MVLAKDIDALLPQTQCGECGYPGCMPYAQAILAGRAEINLCSPGGVKTILRLGELLQKDATHYVKANSQKLQPMLAKIREDECIGCTKCIDACPVDAIIGTAKHMHTVLDFECTGCSLCVEPCPVDCIDIIEAPSPPDRDYIYDPDLARDRFNAKKIRELQAKEALSLRYLEKRKLATNNFDKEAKQDYIMQAMERLQIKKTKTRDSNNE